MHWLRGGAVTKYFSSTFSLTNNHHSPSSSKHCYQVIKHRRWIASTTPELPPSKPRPTNHERLVQDHPTPPNNDQPQNIKPPSSQQLWILFLNAAIPMIGFGFIDNFIMLQAGEYLDTSIGVTFGISTLTAAAVGQIFSDVSGVAMGGIVQAVASRTGFPLPGLDASQRKLGIVRIVGTGGRMIGVVVGCLLGMTSLLFMDLEESQRLRRFRELQPIFTTIIRHTKRLANVSTCRIYLLGVDSEGEEVLFEVGEADGHPVVQSNKSPSTSGPIRAFSHHFNRHATTHHHDPSSTSSSTASSTSTSSSTSTLEDDTSTSRDYLRCVRIAPSDSSTLVSPSIPNHHQINNNSSAEPIVKYVARTGEAVMCVKKRASHPVGTTVMTSSKESQTVDGPTIWVSEYRDDLDLLLTPTSPVTNSVLCYPVFDDMDRDRVIGVIELADKMTTSSNDTGTFTREDERLVRMLSEHLSLYLAMSNYRNANSTEEMESVEKINWVCPEEQVKSS